MKQTTKKTQTREELQLQINLVRRLLEDTPKIIDGKWNSKWFALNGKLTKLKKAHRDYKADISESWSKFLAQ